MRLDPPPIVETILVPLDGSSFSQRSLPAAAKLADRVDAEVALVGVVPSEEDVAARAGELHEIASGLDALGQPVAEVVVVDDDPANGIHQTLQRFDNAIACMASHGHGRPAALLGSVATLVVARWHDPLVLTGPQFDEEATGSGLVVCVDETLESAKMISVGLQWGELLQGDPVTVIVVAEPVPPPTWGEAHRLFGPDGDAEAHLVALAAPFREAGAKLNTEVVYDPVGPTDGVISYLEQHPAEMVVVGTRARTGVARLAGGSVAASVVHRSPVPVVVVPR